MKRFLIIAFIGLSNIGSSQTWSAFPTSPEIFKIVNGGFYCNVNTNSFGFVFNKNVYSTTGYFGSGDADLRFTVNGLQGMLIQKVTGNVGLGTTNPSARLHVVGGMKVDYNTTNDWTYGFAVNVNRDYTKAITVNSSASGGNMFTVWGNGVVNIKSLYAEAIEVNVNAMQIYWPDYVFSSNYQLRPLSEVETFIRKHNHLPEVPSAKTVEEEGLDLAEMNAVLLKKIEELTLYIIEQDKRIGELEKRNE